MAEPDELPSRNLVNTESRVELGAAVPLAAAEAEQLRSPRVSSPTRDAWRRFRHNWGALIALAVIILIVIAAVFAPFMHTSDPTAPDFNAIYAPPSGTHWFGADQVGHDNYSRLVYALRIPLLIGLIGTLLTTIIGTVIGLISGYAGGVLDSVLSRLTDVMFAFPAFLLSLIVVSMYGPTVDQWGMAGVGRVILLTVVFGLVSWPPLMRFVRSLALSMKEQQFIEAARTSGSGSWKIMRRHLLPNMYGLILVQAGFIVVAVISNETVLAIFGLTVQEPNPDIGFMLYQGVLNVESGYWLVLFPGLVLAVLILGFTFLSDGIRDAVDPRTRG